MSRSYKKQPFWSICGWSSRDKVYAARSVRRSNKVLIRKTIDFEDYSPLRRSECAHNNVYSWSSDGKKRWHSAKRKNPPEVIEIDLFTQIERALDRLPIINKTWDDPEEYALWFKSMLRK